MIGLESGGPLEGGARPGARPEGKTVVNNSHRPVRWIWPVVVAAAGGWSAPSAADDSLELFRTRIAPILESPNPSSCSECHLSGVDLKQYIGDSQEETFAALVAGGLVNRERPDESKLLDFIRRSPKTPSPVGAAAREQEYEAFRAWIRAAVADPNLAAAATEVDQLGPAVPVEVIRHGRQDRVLRSFVENIWSEVGRCVSCHSPELNRRAIGRNGFTEADVDAISWVAPRGPAGTLQNLLDLGEIDLDDPEESLVLTKPLGLVEHRGGPKFAVGSRTDKNFRRFLNDYARVLQGGYQSADELPSAPAEVAVLTNQQLRIVDLPADWDDRLLKVDLYRWTDGAWSEDRWGTAEGPIAKERRLWQSMISAIAPRDSVRAARLGDDYLLPDARYLAKIYIDRENLTKDDRDHELGDEAFFAEIEFAGEWPPGYQPPKIVSAAAQD